MSGTTQTYPTPFAFHSNKASGFHYLQQASGVGNIATGEM